MPAYDPAAWSDFALAQLGASAALLGLVFVGFSINLRDIVTDRLLVNRALEAVTLLGCVLVTSTAVLIPGQSRDALAIELLVVAVVVGLAFVWLQGGTRAWARAQGRNIPRGSVGFRRVSAFGSAALVAIVAVSLLACEGGGLYWWPAAVVLAYFGALVNAWVLIVEILR